MKSYLRIGALALLWPFVVAAQTPGPTINATVSGRISDQRTQEPLVRATVQIKGTTNGATTNADGKFILRTGQKLPFTLVVSFIGYAPKEVLADSPTVTIWLEPGNRQLSEVVVVGYGTQERKNVIGSISKIDPSEILTIPTGNFDAALQGKVPGVQISTNTGVPGEAVNIRVRGATSINADNDPLYVIDGVFINNDSLQTIGTNGKATSPVADLNSNDIASIEVLKDAEATALYGSRGANGVIPVTTKRGNFDLKPQINFTASQGWAKGPGSGT